MIEAWLLLAFFVVLFIGFWLKDKQLFAPWNITLEVWIIILFLYLVVDHGLYPITTQLTNSLFLWVVGFCFSAYIGYLLTPSHQGGEWGINNMMVNILAALSVVFVPIGCYMAVTSAMSGASTNVFFNLRSQAVDNDLFDLGPIKYFINIIYALLLIEVNRNKIEKKRLFLVLFLGILFFIITMSKSTFFMLIFSCLYLLYVNKKITLKPIVIFLASFIFFAVALQTLRSYTGDNTELDAMWFLSVYVVSPIVTFCTEVTGDVEQWGENTLRTFYVILNALGFDVEVKDVIQEFVYVPYPSNVYTILSPFYKDFGYIGVFIFAMIQGLFIGSVYKKSVTGNNILKLVYTYLFVLLTLQFFQENLFLGLSSFLQIIILLLICHTKLVLVNNDSLK